MSRNDALSSGLTLYMQRGYGYPLKAFELYTMTMRAHINKKLDRLRDALRIYTATKLAPVAPRGDGQSESSPTRIRAEFQTLREETRGSLRTLSIFDIPVEVQTHILGFAVCSGDPDDLTLSLVCRTWKELVTETPSLWCHFDLGRFATQRVADAQLKRAKGIFTSLMVNSRTWADCKYFLRSSGVVTKGFWSRIEELELGGGSLLGSLPAEAIPQLRLRRFIVNVCRGEETWKDMNKLDTSSIRDLAIRGDNWCEGIESKGLPFSGLTTLELGGSYRSEPFFELLRRNPTLEALILKQSMTSDAFLETGEPIHLPLLRRIELSDRGPFDVILRCVMMPKLSVFQFNTMCSDDVTPCIEAILSQGISGIHQFYLHNCRVSFPSLRSLLQSSSSLSHLTLSSLHFYYEGGINSVVEALCGVASGPGVDGPPSSILCPKLRYLDLSRSYLNLKVEPLISLVKMRRNPPAAPENETPCTSVQSNQSQNRPLPILYLNIDDCYGFTPDDLEWFRDVVPLVSSEMDGRFAGMLRMFHGD